MSRQFGKFELLRKIATGGMAEIHIARQRGMEGFEKIIVIKMILPHLASNQEFVQMFLDEARIAARLTHPNIVQIYDLGRAGGTYFIAMEYIQGENLRTISKQCRRNKTVFPVEHVVKIISQACEGLHYAHTKSDTSGKPLDIVHRDISPQNILVSFEGITKLVDFGIAKAANQYEETRSGTMKGKFSYMSPEQCKLDPVDHRSDLFSMGIVLWELVTGLRLFKLHSDLAIMREITDGKITPPRQLNQEVPEELEAIVLKALEKNPDDRFQDALQMHLALETFLKNKQLTSSSIHLSAFMRTLFKEKLDSLRKTEQAQAADDSLGALLFDDLNLQDEMYIPGTDTGTESDPGAEETSTPSRSASPRPAPAPAHPVKTVESASSGKARNVILGILLGALIAVLGFLGYLVYQQRNVPLPPPPQPTQQEVAAAGVIQVTSIPSGATFSIDGKVRGSTPGNAELSPGVEHLLEITLQDHQPWSTRLRLEAGGTHRKYHALLERLPVPVFGTVELNSRPAGAMVSLDDNPIAGSTPLTIPHVTADQKHTVRVSLKGHKDWITTFTLKRDETLKLSAVLPGDRGKKPAPKEPEPRPPPAPPTASAQISINAKPWATVFVDGTRVGNTPLIDHTVAAGTHSVRLVNDELQISRTVEIGVKPGESVRKTFEFSKGSLQVNAKPWGEVSVRGKKLGTTPFEPLELYEGTYEVTVENPALGRSAQRTVTIKAGETSTITVDFMQ